jgi:hypothetical protein
MHFPTTHEVAVFIGYLIIYLSTFAGAAWAAYMVTGLIYAPCKRTWTHVRGTAIWFAFLAWRHARKGSLTMAAQALEVARRIEGGTDPEDAVTETMYGYSEKTSTIPQAAPDEAPLHGEASDAIDPADEPESAFGTMVIRAHRKDLAAFYGHHADQFGDSAAGPAIAEAALRPEVVQELFRCRNLRMGPEFLDHPGVYEVLSEGGEVVGVLYCPADSVVQAKVVEFRTRGGR